MGLSVVEEAVAGLQGHVWGEPRPGGGTVFRLSAPLTVSTHHVILLRVGAHRFALPARGIRKLLRFGHQAIEMVEGKETIRVMGRPVPLARLADVLGLPAAAPVPQSEAIRAVVVRVGRESLALAVDALLDEREAIVKELGLPAGSAGMSSGGVLLEDGSVAVVLDPVRLVQAFQTPGSRPGIKPAPALAAADPSSILVVDDSITTRALEKSILEAHGYRVRIAVDGLDALGQLRAELPDLVIADVTMPRMDGFQLLEAMKQDKRTASIPVIMVTSMESREDQERGLALGAEAYLIKRKFDQRDLLETVRQIL
jgi:two-component system chemotaxis sensor kinase CheA